MQDHTEIRLERRSKASAPAVGPETIPDLARYLGITAETLSQLMALHHLRERQKALRNRQSLAAALV